MAWCPKLDVDDVDNDVDDEDINDVFGSEEDDPFESRIMDDARSESFEIHFKRSLSMADPSALENTTCSTLKLKIEPELVLEREEDKSCSKSTLDKARGQNMIGVCLPFGTPFVTAIPSNVTSLSKK